MRMKRLKKSELILITVVFTILVGYLYYTLFISKILDEKAVAKANLQSKNDKIQELKLVRKSNKKKEEKYEELQQEAEKYAEVITKSDRLPQISYDLKKYVENHQLIITSLKFQEGASLKMDLNTEEAEDKKKDTFDGIRSINVSLTIEGEYRNVRGMLDALEKDERLIYISSVKTSGKGEGTSLVTSNVELSYYSKAEFEENVDYEFNNGNYGQEEMFR
jgi:hypothetical protein